MESLNAARRLRIKSDVIAAYENAHQRVCPELLAKLKASGHDYSIFLELRRGEATRRARWHCPKDLRQAAVNP